MGDMIFRVNGATSPGSSRLYALILKLFLLSGFFVESYASEDLGKSPESKADSNPYKIDYPSLDKKYYQHIKNRGRYYDSEIIKIIESVDEGEKRNGVFVGVGYGGNINLATPILSSSAFIGSDSLKLAPYNPLLWYMRIGYQNYTSPVLFPNFLGFAVYVDSMQSYKEGALTFTGINLDLLVDIAKYGSKLRSIVGASLGIGIGSVKLTGLAVDSKTNKFEAGYKLNLGFYLFVGYHNRLSVSTSLMQGMQEALIGVAWNLGYDYVF